MNPCVILDVRVIPRLLDLGWPAHATARFSSASAHPGRGRRERRAHSAAGEARWTYPKRQVTIVAGERGRMKRVKLEGVTAERVAEKLKP